MPDFASVLRFVVDAKASDIHLKVGLPPRIRVDGQLVDTPFERLTHESIESLSRTLIPTDRAEEFAATNEADFALSVRGVGRFRCNAFRQRGSVGMVMRRVAVTMPSIEELGLPPVVARLAGEHRGLVLVTGPTGSGKTSTLASMIDHINATQCVNIVTIEDPIEVLHTDKLAMVNQREIGTDTRDYPQAMRRVLRQDPDVILVGEMRDAETVKRGAVRGRDRPHGLFHPAHHERG